MEKWNKSKEIKLWMSSDKVTLEFLSPLICGVEVSMFNKFHLLLTMIFLSIENSISTELVEVVDSGEKVLLLILSKIKI